MGNAFGVIPYDVDALIALLAESSDTDPDVVRRKMHCVYFEEYFCALGAQTIVIERDYVDHDYLEDFAAYYVRCFQEYKRKTVRLHFFSHTFTEADFKSLLSDDTAALSADKLQAGYLGFIIVKPLPGATIGRSCLMAYPDENGRRNFPILRTYEIGLFGLKLTVESLAFQQQDTVVAACATSALWTCFQGTGKRFQHAIPSPVEITQAATDHVPDDLLATGARTLPNAGLTATQMAFAIRAATLEPHAVRTPDPYILNGTLYAYLRCGIPSILLFQLFDVTEANAQQLGGHAVAVTGFSLGQSAMIPHALTGLQLRSSRIDKIYAHDDQIGPFARMTFNATGALDTSWKGKGRVEGRPGLVLIPLYHKIRIPFEVIHDDILALDGIMDWVRKMLGSQLQRPEWDIYLTTVSEYKKDIHAHYRSALGVRLEDHLTESLPKYLWRVTALHGQEAVMDMVFDATGIAQHNLVLQTLILNKELADLLQVAIPQVIPEIEEGHLKNILQQLAL
jgi:hypothetical protein